MLRIRSYNAIEAMDLQAKRFSKPLYGTSKIGFFGAINRPKSRETFSDGSFVVVTSDVLSFLLKSVQ